MRSLSPRRDLERFYFLPFGQNLPGLSFLLSGDPADRAADRLRTHLCRHPRAAVAEVCSDPNCRPICLRARSAASNGMPAGDRVPDMDLRYRNKQPQTHAKRLLMPPAKSVTVGRLQKPTVLSIRGGPKHEVERELAGNFGSLRRERPLWSNADHKLDFV